MFSYTPKTAKDLEEMNLLKEGEYPFEILSAEEKVSAKGNNMIKLKLNVFDGDRESHVYDYLLGAKMDFKLRHFCESIGVLDKYEAGTFSVKDCENRTGEVSIAIRKDKNGDFPPSNVVKDYVVKDLGVTKDQQGDNIPF